MHYIDLLIGEVGIYTLIDYLLGDRSNKGSNLTKLHQLFNINIKNSKNKNFVARLRPLLYYTIHSYIFKCNFQNYLINFTNFISIMNQFLSPNQDSRYIIYKIINFRFKV